MTTDISVRNTGNYSVSARAWLRGTHGTDPGSMPSVPLDLTKFTGTNFADGTIKSGCVLGQITATKKYGPYNPAATDGSQTAVGFLWNTVTIGTNTAARKSDAMFVHGFVDDARSAVSGGLPYTSGLGSLDAAARTALATRVYFV